MSDTTARRTSSAKPPLAPSSPEAHPQVGILVESATVAAPSPTFTIDTTTNDDPQGGTVVFSEEPTVVTSSSPLLGQREVSKDGSPATATRMSVSLLEDSLAVDMDTEFAAPTSTDGNEKSGLGTVGGALRDEDAFAPSPENNDVRLEHDNHSTEGDGAPFTVDHQPTGDNDVSGGEEEVSEKGGGGGGGGPHQPLAYRDPLDVVAMLEARQDKKMQRMYERRTEEVRQKELKLERALNEIKVREVALTASERAHGSLLQYDETVSDREQRVIEAEAQQQQRTSEVQKREQEVIRMIKEQELKYTSLIAPLAAREQEISRRTEDLAAKETDLEHRIHIHMRKMAHDEEVLSTKERAARDLENRAREQLQGLDKKQTELDLLNTHLQKKQKLLRSEEQEVDNRERELTVRELQANQQEAKFAANTEKLELRESSIIVSTSELQAASAALDVRTSQLNAREQRLSAEAGTLVDAEKDVQFHRKQLDEREAYTAKVMRQVAVTHEEAQIERDEAALELKKAQSVREEVDGIKVQVKRQLQQYEAKVKSLQQRETAIKLALYDLEQRQQRFPLLRSQYLASLSHPHNHNGGGADRSMSATSKRDHNSTVDRRNAASIYTSRVARSRPLADEISSGKAFRKTTASGKASSASASRSLPPIHSTGLAASYDNPLPLMQRPRLTPLVRGGSAQPYSGPAAASITELALSHKPPSQTNTPETTKGTTSPRGLIKTPVKLRVPSPEATPSSWGSIDTPSTCRFISTTLSSNPSSDKSHSSDVEEHKEKWRAQRTRRSEVRLASKQARFRKRRALQVAKLQPSENADENGGGVEEVDTLAKRRTEVNEHVSTYSRGSADDATFIAAAHHAAELRASEQFCNTLSTKLQDHLQGIIEGRQRAPIDQHPPTGGDDDISWEVVASPQKAGSNNTTKGRGSLSSFPASKGTGISVYRNLADDQVRELFTAYSNQDDAKTEYEFLLYRVLAQDPHLKPHEGSLATPSQDAALVHRLASMQVLLGKASTASHEPTSSLTASYATATLLAVQGRLRDLLAYRKELSMEALSIIETAISNA